MPEHRERRSIPVYTNRTVSANFRGPEFPQGFFGIQSMMDDVAYKLKMDPVEFILKNMTRKSRDEVPYTNYTLEECIHARRRSVRVEEALAAAAGFRSAARSSAAPACRSWRSAPALGRSSAVIRLDAKGSTRVFVGVTDVGGRREDDDGDDRGRGARRAAVAGRRRLGRHRSLSVFGRRVRQPHDDHDRLRRGRGGARPEEADRREGIAERRRRARRRRRSPNPTLEGKVRSAFGAHFVEVEVDTELGRVARHQIPRRARLRTHHESAHRAQPDQGRRDRWASAWRCTRTCSTTAAAAAADGRATTARASRRIATRRRSKSIFIETDDGYGPFGAKSMGESSKVPAPAAVANAVFNAIGRRMKDLPITRDKILGALA